MAYAILRMPGFVQTRNRSAEDEILFSRIQLYHFIIKVPEIKFYCPETWSAR